MTKQFWWAVRLIGILLIVLAATLHADVPQRRLLAPQAAVLTCSQELSAIRESMFRSSMGEAVLSKQYGDIDAFNAFINRAHVVMHGGELRPSPTTCTRANLDSLRIMAHGWEYEYLLDQAAIFKLENQR